MREIIAGTIAAAGVAVALIAGPVLEEWTIFLAGVAALVIGVGLIVSVKLPERYGP